MHTPPIHRRILSLNALVLLAILTVVATGCQKKDPLNANVNSSELLDSQGVDTFSLYTSTFYEDSVLTSNHLFGILGSCEDPVFGRVNSEIYTQLHLLNQAPVFDNPTQITIDSVVLGMVYSGMYGNPGNQTVEVYEIGGTEVLSEEAYTFSSYPETGNNLVPAGTGVYYLDPNTETIINAQQHASQLRIKLDNNLGWQIINDGYNTPSNFATDEAFVTYFKGLKIKTNNGTQSSGDGGLFYFDLDDPESRLTIYYTSAGESRQFHLEMAGNNFNHIDFTTSNAVQSVIDNAELGQKEFYTQSFHSRALIEIPGLSSIPSRSVVHSATLELPVQYQSGQPFEPGLDISVMLFADDTQSSYLWDRSTIGLYNVATKTFTIDVRDYVQKILSGEAENTGFILSPYLFGHTADRIVFNGPETDNKAKPRFTIVYTEF